MIHVKCKDQAKDILTIFEAGMHMDSSTNVAHHGHWCHVCKSVMLKI